MDQEFSNSYEAWKKLGSPAKPSPEQYATLERAGQLQSIESPKYITPEKGSTEVRFDLPRHGVSLVRLTWR